KTMNPQLRQVLTGAAAVSALFVVGIVLGSLYPRTPMATPSAQSSSGAAPAQSGGVTVKAGGPATLAATPAKPSPSAARVARNQAPPADKPSPRADQTQRIAAQQGEEDMGDDVVIRHYQRPAPTQKPKQSGQ